MNHLKFFVLQSILCGILIITQLFSYDYITNGFNFPTFLVLLLNAILILLVIHVYQKFSSIRSLIKILLLIFSLLTSAIIIGLITGDIQIG